MIQSFIECRLGDVLTLQRGFDLPASVRKPGLVPVVSSSGITGTHDVAQVRGPGVVIGRYGTLGEVFFVETEFWPLNTALYVKDFKGNDPRYCAYLLKTIGGASTSAAAAVPGVNRNVLHELRVHRPTLATQRRIASILGAYDDLIEVNRRRIAVLEEMARRLFEEWFVQFRFPGHVPGEAQAGDLPPGWQLAPLEDLLVLQRGFDLPSATRRVGPNPVIAASGLHGTHAEFRVKGPGVTTGRSGTLGLVNLVHDDFWPLNTTLYVREFRRASPAYALHLLRHLKLGGHGGGAAVPTLNRNHVHALQVPCPPSDLVARFEAQAMTMLLAAHNCEKQNERLAASRDLLLPRLISGELEVKAAEQALEAVA